MKRLQAVRDWTVFAVGAVYDLARSNWIALLIGFAIGLLL